MIWLRRPPPLDFSKACFVFSVIEETDHLSVCDGIALLDANPFHGAHETRTEFDALAVDDVAADCEDRAFDGTGLHGI